jgi:FkbM family methyltransferase
MDVGAHVGAFSLRLLEACPSATVHSYEPSQTTVEYLRRNIADNSANVTVHDEAVSGETGTALFVDNRHGSTINRLDPENPEAKPVRTISFRDALASLPSRPSLLKLDCEGAEYDIILGSTAEDWTGIQRVVMEYHPVPGRSLQDIQQHLGTYGFQTLATEQLGAGLGLAWFARSDGS